MSRETRILIVLNHQAARARFAWTEIKSYLAENALRFDLHETKHAGEATQVVHAALREGFQTIAVIGGDGTLSEAASGFFEFDKTKECAGELDDAPEQFNSDAVLAILPAGTGDDFARGLCQGRREPLHRWLAALVAHYHAPDEQTTRTIDVIAAHVNGSARQFICLNVATIGIGAEVASRVAMQNRLMKRLPGEARFISAAFQSLLAWRERDVRLTIDETEEILCRTNLIAVANGAYAGGGMMFAPEARTDDGLMDVLMACRINRPTILCEMQRIRHGRHLDNPRVRVQRAQRVRIETLAPEDSLAVEADGNVRGHTPAEFHVLPAALKIVAPPK